MILIELMNNVYVDYLPFLVAQKCVLTILDKLQKAGELTILSQGSFFARQTKDYKPYMLLAWRREREAFAIAIAIAIP